MTKAIRKIDMGEGKILVNVTLTDENESSDPVRMNYFRSSFLYEFWSNPQLWNCESVPFEKMEMSHNGENWVIKLTANIEAI